MLQSFLDAQARGRARIDNRAGIPTQSIGPEDGVSVRVVTYNIHTCVGVDRRYDPGRVAAVLREIDADLLFGDRVLRIIATHFGLRAAERRLQANRLVSALAGSLPPHRREAEAVLLMGDLNEWRGRSGAIRAFDRQLGPSAAERTFPSWMPVLALDRIYADGPAVLRDVEVYRSPLARLASDHLPLVGNLYWDGHTAWRRERSRSSRRRSRAANDQAKAHTLS